MEMAGIQYEGRHHGPHALRHYVECWIMGSVLGLSWVKLVFHAKTLPIIFLMA
jgi:hypothetical protein